MNKISLKTPDVIQSGEFIKSELLAFIKANSKIKSDSFVITNKVEEKDNNTIVVTSILDGKIICEQIIKVGDDMGTKGPGTGGGGGGTNLEELVSKIHDMVLVLSSDFTSFKTYVVDKFEQINQKFEQIDNRFVEMKNYVDNGFVKMKNYVDNKFEKFETEIKSHISDEFKKHIDKYHK